MGQFVSAGGLTPPERTGGPGGPSGPSGGTPNLPLLALLLALLVSLSPSNAVADANAEARFYFERGNEGLARAMRSRGAARRTAMRAALADYLESLRIVRSKNTVYNLAVVYEELGQLEDSFDYFSEYLRTDINDAERAEATRRIEAVRPRVAVVEVQSMPSGAEVFVDRRDLAARGRTPLSLAVPAGHHTIFLVLAGHAPAEASIDAVVGQTHRQHQQLTALPAAVSIETQGPPADILIDGRPAGRTPLHVTLAAGAHEVRLRRAGSGELRERVELHAGEDRTLRLTLPALPLAGGLAVRANVPAAQVSVDGIPWGVASTTPRGLNPGMHTVDVAAPDYRPASLVVQVPEGRAIIVRARLSPEEPPRRYGPLPLITGIATGVSLAVGALVGLSALRRNDDIGEAHVDFDDARAGRDTSGQLDARDRAETAYDDTGRLNTIADVGWVGGAVLGTLTVVLLATAGGADPGPSAVEVEAR